MPVVHIPSENRTVPVPQGTVLLDALKNSGIYPDAPCGGNGQCGKCKVTVNGREVLACQTPVDGDMTVALPHAQQLQILAESAGADKIFDPLQAGNLLAVDMGTTSLVCTLLDGKTGRQLAQSSACNPQIAFGADVVSRIRAAGQGHLAELTALIRSALTDLIRIVCAQAGIDPQTISVICPVGNPAMQQIFLGIAPDNLAAPPFAPVLTEGKAIPCKEILPMCPRAQLLIVPNIGGFVGADTMGCLLATRPFDRQELTLLVDIGTNGEMVLCRGDRMVACATAAGPALEGASIHFGMRAAQGAIDHVWIEKGSLRCSVIGGSDAVGICGSGLVDAVAMGLELGLINKRGRILTPDRCLHLTENIFLTQEDIRQVQLAKGAICAGVLLLARHLGARAEDIQTVLLAGAFGNYVNTESACRIGLLPESLLGKIRPVGNAALGGARMLCCDRSQMAAAQALADTVTLLDLAGQPDFSKTFAGAMLLREGDPTARWVEAAKALGFDVAVAMDPKTLVAREDVRAMCAADTCGAYHKNWTCPPLIGSLEDCRAHMGRYRRGILVQSVGYMQKTVDSRCLRETEQRHLDNFHRLAQALRAVYPDALCLGAGGCRVCPRCAYPEPCRFPQQALSSMEGYGLFVTQVCRDAGIAYHHGEKTITFTALALF